MLLLFKKIIAPLVLASFLMLVVLGLTMVTHGMDGRMQGDCPFSVMGASICPQDILSVAFHHLSAFRSFFSVPTYSNILTLIFSLIFSTFLIFAIYLNPALSKPWARRGNLPDLPRATSYDAEVLRWLSLHVNSPAFF